MYLARLETANNGKPYTEALAEVGYTVDVVRYYAGWCDKIHGNTVPCGEESSIYCVCVCVCMCVYIYM